MVLLRLCVGLGKQKTSGGNPRRRNNHIRVDDYSASCYDDYDDDMSGVVSSVCTNCNDYARCGVPVIYCKQPVGASSTTFQVADKTGFVPGSCVLIREISPH